MYMCILHSLLHWLCAYISLAVCLHVSAHKSFLHVMPNVYFTWSEPVVCRGIAASDPYQCSSVFECFIPPADPEDLCWFWLLGHLHSLAAVLLLNTACVIHHMLSGAVKSSHDKYCFSVYETIMLASHFKQPLSSTVDCSALAKSVLWARGVIIQRQEDVSFAKSMKYNIIHYLCSEGKKAEKTTGKTLA